MEKRVKDLSNPSKSRSVSGIANHIALNAILAAATQVATPVKPGNVHRYNDFKVTKMEHYLSSAIFLNIPMSQMATRGIMVERGLIDIDEVDMGWIIGEAAKDGGKWHTGGITNLGMLFLFSPIAAAAGHLISSSDSVIEYEMNLNELPSVSVDFIENTTPEDTVNIFTSLYKITAIPIRTLTEREIKQIWPQFIRTGGTIRFYPKTRAETQVINTRILSSGFISRAETRSIDLNDYAIRVAEEVDV